MLFTFWVVVKLENVWCKPEIESAHLQGKSCALLLNPTNFRRHNFYFEGRFFWSVLYLYNFSTAGWVACKCLQKGCCLPHKLHLQVTVATCQLTKQSQRGFSVQYPLCNHFHANIFLRPLTNQSENKLLSSFFFSPCNLCLPDDHWPVIRYVWLRPKANRMQLSTV